jgi:diguanylate cyclase (GGDEF)-like protein
LEPESFNYLLDLEVHKAVRYLYFFSLLVVQIDGHGDEQEKKKYEDVSPTLSRLIREAIRGTDVVGQAGGTKFLVMLHQSDYQQARTIGERILQRIKNYSFMEQDQEIGKTVSVGGACFPTHANNMNGLMTRAEEMLSKSMEEGRNAISLPD